MWKLLHYYRIFVKSIILLIDKFSSLRLMKSILHQNIYNYIASTVNNNVEEEDNTKMMVGVMRPEEHSYANNDADHYFENTFVPSSQQNEKNDE